MSFERETQYRLIESQLFDALRDAIVNDNHVGMTEFKHRAQALRRFHASEDDHFKICQFAAFQRKQNHLLELLDMGFAPDPRQPHGLNWGDLAHACCTGNLLQALSRILPRCGVESPTPPAMIGPSWDRKQAECNRTLLMTSCASNANECAALLIEQGADIHAKTSWGNTPLFHCNVGDNSHLTQWLLTLGADPDQPNQAGNTPRAFHFGKNIPTAFLSALERFEMERDVASARAANRNAPSL